MSGEDGFCRNQTKGFWYARLVLWLSAERGLRIGAVAALAVALAVWWWSAMSGDEGTVAVLITHAPPAAFVAPPLVLAIGTVVKRSWLSALLSVAAVIVAAVPLGGFALHTSIASRGPTLSVMTYNVEKWSHGANRVATTLTDHAPDVFCLQEAGSYYYVADVERQLAEFARALSSYQLVRQGELMIGTRFQVLSQSFVALPVGPDSRPLLEAVIKTPDGGSISILTAHLLYTAYYSLSPDGFTKAARARREQAAAILTYAAKLPRPVVLCGDFNAGIVSSRQC